MLVFEKIQSIDKTLGRLRRRDPNYCIRNERGDTAIDLMKIRKDYENSINNCMTIN